MRSDILSLLFRGLLFTLLVNFPLLLELASSGGLSLDSFNDPDEVFYIDAALRAADFRPQEAIYYEHNKQLPLADFVLHWRPDQSLIPIAIGTLGNFFDLGPAAVGAVLDVVFVSLSYVLFVLLFRMLCRCRLSAELSAGVLLGFPWIFSANNFLHIDLTSYLPVDAPRFINHTALPVLEGIAGQVSYPLFALSFIFLIQGLKPSPKLGKLFIAGVTSGLLSYCYFFAWGATGATITFFLLFCRGDSQKQWDLKRRLQMIAAYGAGAALSSFPFLWQMARLSQSGQGLFVGGEIFRTVWYFSVEWFLVLLLVLWYYLRQATNNERQKRATLIIAAILAEFVLLNAQPLIKTPLQPIFFSVMYLHPLISALAFSLLFEAGYNSSKYRKFCAVLAVALVILLPVKTYALREIRFYKDPEFTELVKTIASKGSSDSVSAILTYDNAFQSDTYEWLQRPQANFVSALTKSHVLKESWGLDSVLPKEELAKRELVLGLLFTGKLQPVRICPEQIVVTENTMFFQQWISYQLRRKLVCKELRKLQQTVSPCEALDWFKLDYIIWEPELLPEKPKGFEQFADLVWRSTVGRYQLFAFERSRAKEFFCGAVSGER